MPKSSTTTAIVQLLRAAMGKRAISPLALAKLSGVPQATVRRLMRQAVMPTTEVIERLAVAVGLPVSDVLGAATTATSLVVNAANPAQAKRVARLNIAYASCDAAAQRLLLELAERLAAQPAKRPPSRQR